jgi:hypothetical protein
VANTVQEKESRGGIRTYASTEEETPGNPAEK